jgi:hypothetical protein
MVVNVLEGMEGSDFRVDVLLAKALLRERED